jgi:hypothetical protein
MIARSLIVLKVAAMIERNLIDPKAVARVEQSLTVPKAVARMSYWLRRRCQRITEEPAAAPIAL